MAWLLEAGGGLPWWSEQKKGAGEVKESVKTGSQFHGGILELPALEEDP